MATTKAMTGASACCQVVRAQPETAPPFGTTQPGPFRAIGPCPLTDPGGSMRGAGESGLDMSGVGGAGSAPVRARLPQSSGGWWAVGLSAVGLGSWVVLPVLTVTLRDTYPVTDTWVMPAIGSVLIGVAAVVDVLCFVRRWDRSMLNVVAAAVTVPAALLAIAMVVGEGLAGV